MDHCAAPILWYNEPMNDKSELYRPGEPERLKKRRSVWLTAVCVIAAGALVLCVLFCLLTGTANAMRMELSAIAVFTLAGWVDIYLLTFRVAALGREEDHVRRMLAGERETVRGRTELAARTVRIRKSIAVRTVTVREDGQTRRLFVNAARARSLEQALGGGERMCELDVVSGYVAACKVLP